MQIDTRKEILLIIIAAVGISIVYNTLSDNGLPLIRKGIQLKWENDSSIDSLINTDLVFREDTILNKTSEKILSTNNSEIIPKANQGNLNIISEHNTAPKHNTLISNYADSLQLDTLQKYDSVYADIDKAAVPAAITVDQAYRLYNAGAVFLDARIEADYNFGHIKGAVSLPYNRVDEHISRISGLPKNSTFITYCDGVGCDASIDLAKRLAELGYTNVKIFYSGWNDWKDNNYPAE
jgi:rhodanese-related sulfurtransferase